MKQIIKILSFLFFVMLTVSMVSATANDQLPTKEDVSNLLDKANGKSASDVMDMVKERLPAANADLLKNGNDEAISVYWTNPDSSKGYGATYFKDGKIVLSSDLCGYTVKETYIGEIEKSDSDESTSQDSSSDDEKDVKLLTNDESSNNKEYTYDNLVDALDNYDGSVSCSSERCADNLSEYLSDDGWTVTKETKTFKTYGTRYCVSVKTDDEGTVYVVLRA